MFCNNCGAKVKDGAKFCTSCGQELKAPDFHNSTRDGASIPNLRKTLGTLYTVVGVCLSLRGVLDLYDYWSDFQLLEIYSCIIGAGFVLVGILQLLNKEERIVSIFEIVFSLLLFAMAAKDWSVNFVGVLTDLYQSRSYVEIYAGIGILAVGVLGVLHKSGKAIAIVEIIFSSIVLLDGIDLVKIDWSYTTILAGAAVLAAGILKLKSIKRNTL